MIYLSLFSYYIIKTKLLFRKHFHTLAHSNIFYILILVIWSSIFSFIIINNVVNKTGTNVNANTFKIAWITFPFTVLACFTLLSFAFSATLRNTYYLYSSLIFFVVSSSTIIDPEETQDPTILFLYIAFLSLLLFCINTLTSIILISILHRKYNNIIINILFIILQLFVFSITYNLSVAILYGFITFILLVIYYVKFLNNRSISQRKLLLVTIASGLVIFIANISINVNTKTFDNIDIKYQDILSAYLVLSYSIIQCFNIVKHEQLRRLGGVVSVTGPLLAWFWDAMETSWPAVAVCFVLYGILIYIKKYNIESIILQTTLFVCMYFLIFTVNIFQTYNILIWTIILFSLLLMSVRHTSGTTSLSVIYSLLAIFTISSFGFDLNLKTEEYHQGFFLGPVLDVINGRSALVDVSAQYGVGIFYFLSLLFLLNPINVNLANFSFLLNIIDIFYILIIFVIIKKLTKSDFYALAIVFIGLMVNRSNPDGGLVPQIFPSTGGLRYVWGLLPVLLLSFTTLRHLRIALLIFVLSVANSWSSEALVAANVSLFSIYVAEYLKYKKSVYVLVKAGIGQLLLIISSWAGLAAFTYFRSDHSIEVDNYLDYVRLYASGFGWVSPDLHSVWSVYCLSYVSGAVLALCLPRFAVGDYADRKGPLILFSLSMVGFMQSLYYVYRAHTSNLYHIMWIPLIIIAFIVKESYLRSRSYPVHRHALVGLIVAFGSFAGGAANAYSKQLPYTPFGVVIRAVRVEDGSEVEYRRYEIQSVIDRQRVPRDEELYRWFKTLPVRSELALFVTEASLFKARSGTSVTNRLKIAFAPQDEVSANASTRAFNEVDKLQPGDVVILGENVIRDRGIMLPLVVELCAKKKLIIDYKSDHFIWAEITDANQGENVCRALGW